MNVESATDTLLMRAQQEPAQPPRPKFTTEHLNAWFTLTRAVAEKVAKCKADIIMPTFKDTTLTDEGKAKKFAAKTAEITKEFAFVPAQLNEVRAALSRLQHVMLDPITAKPKGDPDDITFSLITYLREQELRHSIPKAERDTAYLRALEGDDLESARAILNAPGSPWVTGDIRRRAEDAYAERRYPKEWEQAQSLEYFQSHVESLVAQVRTWFLALGAPKDVITKTLGD